jgi:guanylate kinase
MSNKIRRTQGLLVVLSAPSGCGKTSVVERLLIRHQDWMRSVSTTTRSPRLGEENGTHYHFISKEAFECEKARNAFLEWAEIYGQYYGTPRQCVTDAVDSGKVMILTIDVQGTKQIKESWGTDRPMISVFLLPPSIKALRERLTNRNTETPEEIERRIMIAQDEIKAATLYEKTVINQNLDQAVLEVESIILNELTKRSKK